MSGHVYFIECNGRIKIGFSANPKNRLKGLSTASAHDLVLLGTVEGSVDLERAIHKRLRPYRIRREWFEGCKTVRDLMRALFENGASAIGFVEPSRHPIERPRPLPPQPKPSEIPDHFASPLRPGIARITACMERYVGEHISKARRRETEMGMAPGTLINRLIGGHYSARRAALAFAMIRHANDCLEQITEAVLGGDIDEPVDQDPFVDHMIFIADRLERGVQRLFADPIISNIDISGYEGVRLVEAA